MDADLAKLTPRTIAAAPAAPPVNEWLDLKL